MSPARLKTAWLLFRVQSWRGALIFTAGTMGALAIGYLRCLTGPEYALSLFFIFPVAVVAWFVGGKAGFAMSAICALSWLWADLSMAEAFSNPHVPYINETFRFIVFMIIAAIIDKTQQLLQMHKEFARIDLLTELSNRLSFFESAEMEVKKARRFQQPVSILYIDLDNFKSVNDEHGHTVGDTLLRVVAHTIRANVRSIDLAARLGGDEFAVMLPHTAIQAARLVGTKLRREISHVMKHNQWPVTASIGIVTYENLSVSIQEMVESADAVMYSAKRNGKNRVAHHVVNSDRSRRVID